MQQPAGNNPVASSASPASTGATGTATSAKTHVNGGRFDFDDGGTYCGGWEDGKAHGHGVCTGPKGQGAYSGSWHYGFEVSGVYTWPSGSAFEGQWQNGKRHGLGVETRGRWLYRGEWTQGFKGRYGVRQSATSNAKYEGTWANGLQDGYGSETYADGGTYQGQWLRGMRHGYGVRASAPFGLASHYRPNKTLRASLTSLRSNEGGANGAGAEAAAERDRRVDDSRGGFVLKARSDEPPVRRRSLVEKSSGIKKSILSGLKIRKQRSTGDLEKRGTSGGSIRSTGSSTSWVSTESSHSGVTSGSLHTDSNASFVVEDEQMDASVTETYMGEWKNDKRSGFGISERSDGLRYEGEWFANKKYGYGVTTFRDGSKEEGKYKNNVLITSQKKKHLFLIRSAKFRERIDAAVNAAQRASKIALQKADIAISRTATARGKAELADLAADHAREDFEIAIATAKQFAPDFTQPGLDRLRTRDIVKLKYSTTNDETQAGKPNQQKPPTSSPTTATDTTNVPSTPATKQNLANQTPQKYNTQSPYQSSTQYQSPSQNQNASQQQSLLQAQQYQSSQQHFQKLQQQHLSQTSQQQQYNSTTSQSSSYQSPSTQQQSPYQQSSQQSPYQQSSQQPQYQSQNQQPQQYPSQTSQQQSHQLQQSAQQQSYQSQQTAQQQHYQSMQQQHHQQQSYQSQQQQYPTSSQQQQYQQQLYISQSQQSQQQQQQYQNQNSQPTLPIQSNQPFGTQQPYLGQNLADQLPQTMVSPPTPLPELHKNNPDYSDYPPQARSELRRNSRQVTGEAPGYNFQQAMSDHFDHYKRPPSRDSSVDRYSRAAGRLAGSRQPSVDKAAPPPEGSVGDRTPRGPSVARSGTPVAGNGAAVGAGAAQQQQPYIIPNSPVGQQPPFEEVILRKRGLGQDIVPSPLGQPKRTESLYISPQRKEAPPKGDIFTPMPEATHMMQRPKPRPVVKSQGVQTTAAERKSFAVAPEAIDCSNAQYGEDRGSQYD